LYNQDAVDSAWSHSGKIKFTLKSDTGDKPKGIPAINGRVLVKTGF